MAKNSETHGLSTVSAESKYDVRLLEKKVEHGFLTRQEKEAHLKGLPEETEYDFSSAEVLDAQDQNS